MEKHLSSKIIDNIFLIVSVFVLSFLWIRYYEHNSVLILLYASLVTMLVCSVVHIVKTKKYDKQVKLKNENKLIENLSNYLIFSPTKQVVKTFEETLKSRNIPYKTICDMLVFNDVCVRPIYSKTKCDDADILQTLNKINSHKLSPNKIIICAKSYTEDAKKLVKTNSHLKISLLDEKEVFDEFFKPINYQVEYNSSTPKKKSVKEKLGNLKNIAFNKKRFKGYMISAVVLLIGSYFLRYNIYYLVFASIMLVLAVFSYFNKPYNKKKANIFETNSQKKSP